MKMSPKEFLKKVKDNSQKSVAFGKDMAVEYFQKITNASRKDAENYYVAVRSSYSSLKVVANTSGENIIAFMETGVWAASETHGDAGKYAGKRESFSEGLGIKPSAYASITHRASGDRRFGPVSVSLNGVHEMTACLAGDVLRSLDPSRPDYIADPMMAFYSWDDVADCKASSSILSMPSGRILQGTASILQDIIDGVEFGRAEAFVLGEMSTRNLGKVVVCSTEEAASLRASLEHLSMLVPIYVDSHRDQIVDPWAKRTEEHESEKPSPPMRYLAAGDMIVTKPMASSVVKYGQILDVSDGIVTVQWEDSTRSIWGVSEAMARLMAAPKKPKEKTDLTGYVLDGMDDRTARLLASYGYDPVSLYSMISHAKPAAPMATGWIRPMLEKLESMGIKASKTSGFRETRRGNIAFLKHEWFEARLPDHCRLVIDVNFDELRIVAGDVEEYVKPKSGPIPIWG